MILHPYFIVSASNQAQSLLIALAQGQDYGSLGT